MTATYISTSTCQGRKAWRVIHHCQPLCADRPTVLDALRVYREFMGPEIPAEIPLWDGDRGEWDTVEEA